MAYRPSPISLEELLSSVPTTGWISGKQLATRKGMQPGSVTKRLKPLCEAGAIATQKFGQELFFQRRHAPITE
jgi:hypothetical protein